MPRPTGAKSSSETSGVSGVASRVCREPVGTRPVNHPWCRVGREATVAYRIWDRNRPESPDPSGPRRNVGHMRTNALADFLLPEGFAAPRAGAVLREGSAVVEIGRFALRAAGDRRLRRETSYAERAGTRLGDPVLLVPGFLAGDGSLALMARSLRAQGFRTYRSHIHANVGCTLNAAAQLEARLESIAARRGSRVQVVGHSLGGMLARGLAVRRPDLVSTIVTMGSPMLAPGAHHRSLSASVEVLVRLSRAGVPGLMAEDCVAGACARQSFG